MANSVTYFCELSANIEGAISTFHFRIHDNAKSPLSLFAGRPPQIGQLVDSESPKHVKLLECVDGHEGSLAEPRPGFVHFQVLGSPKPRTVYEREFRVDHWSGLMSGFAIREGERYISSPASDSKTSSKFSQDVFVCSFLDLLGITRAS